METKARRAFAAVLSLAALLILVIPGLALGYEKNNEGLPLIPLTVVNNVSTSPLYIYIKGFVSSHTKTIPDGKWVYVSDLAGNITLIPNIKPGHYTGKLALYLGTAKTTILKFPKLNGVRIYFSIGDPVQVCCSNAVGDSPSEPAGWVKSDTNYNTLFDWAELVWDDGGNRGLGHKTRLGGNVTQVDMFGLPMKVTLQGESPSSDQLATANAGFNVDRQTMMDAYGQLGSPWTNLIMYNSNNVPVRLISPYHGIDLGVFPKEELNSYIDQVFAFYNGSVLKVRASCPQDGGTVHHLRGETNASNNLVFSDDTGVKFQYKKPGTLRVYRNEIHAEPEPASELGQCLSKVVAAKLGGAFIRTSLLTNNDLDACQDSQFYISDPIQKYAQVFHEFGIDNKAYSFGYDDTCDQSSYISVDDPTSMTITLGGGT